MGESWTVRFWLEDDAAHQGTRIFDRKTDAESFAEAKRGLGFTVEVVEEAGKDDGDGQEPEELVA